MRTVFLSIFSITLPSIDTHLHKSPQDGTSTPFTVPPPMLTVMLILRRSKVCLSLMIPLFLLTKETSKGTAWESLTAQCGGMAVSY